MTQRKRRARFFDWFWFGFLIGQAIDILTEPWRFRRRLAKTAREIDRAARVAHNCPPYDPRDAAAEVVVRVTRGGAEGLYDYTIDHPTDLSAHDLIEVAHRLDVAANHVRKLAGVARG